MLLGSLHGTFISINNINVVKGPIKILGIYLSSNPNEIISDNFDSKIDLKKTASKALKNGLFFSDGEHYVFPEDTTGEWHIIASYNQQSKCLSCVIVDFDLKSKVLGLTPNECNKNQIIRETWRQLKEVVDMRRYDHATITKNVYKLGDEYTSTQGSYFRNKKSVTIESDVGNRVSYVGSHNTRPFPFTSYESAIQSGKIFLNKFEYFEGQIPVYNPIGLKDSLVYLILMCLILYFVSRL